MEPDKFVVDSSVFVAFYHQGEHNHQTALEILASLKDKALIVHPYVIQETATVLTYKLGRDAAVKFLSDIEAAANVYIPFVDMAGEIHGFIAEKKKISFTDSALLVLAKKQKAQLLTFDRQMLASFKE
jgi:predicted nucleic acid-binding protein